MINKTEGITLQGTSSPVIAPNNDVMFFKHLT